MIEALSRARRPRRLSVDIRSGSGESLAGSFFPFRRALVVRPTASVPAAFSAETIDLGRGAGVAELVVGKLLAEFGQLFLQLLAVLGPDFDVLLRLS